MVHEHFESEAWLGIDLGTQSVRVLLVTGDGTVLGSGSVPLGGRRDGVRHEQDPAEWWDALRAASRAALRGRSKVRVGGLAVCGTSGTVLLTDGAGRPMSPALMYDDGRATAQGARARMAGLAVQDTWALPKALWLAGTYGQGRITHQPDLVVSLLTGELPPADSSHALKTGYDVERDAWPSMLSRLGLSDTAIPDVVRPGTLLGEVTATAAEATGIPAGTPVLAGMTDGCAAQIASAALRPGAWNSVLGTTLVLKGASPSPVRDPAGVVYNHRAPDGSWLPGGASSVGAGVLTAAFAGADPAAMDKLAAAHEPSGAITYPLVSPGERFPFLAPDAFALVLGEPESDADLWAALLQGVAFTERLCLDYLHHLGAPLDGPLTLTGGAARSPYWNQLRADILGRPARVPEQTEPALGMAALAAYGAGAAPDLAAAAEGMVRIGTTVAPRPDRTARFAEPYARLVKELEERGWLPTPVARHARGRLGGGPPPGPDTTDS
ncbi:FGGY-family carbohydrate kinase [Streptomyces viridochromogenes]|uniref:FGGY-family carbohydrate kinase n=1 Tax=Streptomyces viridochromogenes TaxID=1938 RepID=UPI00069E65D5|nr:FGGY-family carbohydrate kinase [Streptomyces viridochromogenes]KOG12397.1 carbohydrate kinase [Streptomyces viridochromogenes]KOG12584.1 carbohydrate kinase [Streptomyces viridochromogenes]